MTDDLFKAANSLRQHIGEHLCIWVDPTYDVVYSLDGEPEVVGPSQWLGQADEAGGWEGTGEVVDRQVVPLIAYLNGPWELPVDNWHGHPVYYRLGGDTTTHPPAYPPTHLYRHQE